MPILAVARDYLVWHYSTAYVDLVHIWWNYLWFVNHLFSVPEVIMSWIAPFKRMEEAKVNILKSPTDFFGNLLVNLIMRIVGFVLRTSIISIALCGFAFVLAFGLCIIALWTVLPLLVVHFFITGFGSFFS